MQRGVNRRWFFVSALFLLIVGVVAYGTSSPSTFGHSAGELEGVCKSNGDGCPAGVGGSGTPLSCRVVQVGGGSGQTTATALCATGEKRTGGGCTITGTAYTHDTYPVTSGGLEGWYCNSGGSLTWATAHAVCCSGGGGSGGSGGGASCSWKQPTGTGTNLITHILTNGGTGLCRYVHSGITWYGTLSGRSDSSIGCIAVGTDGGFSSTFDYYACSGNGGIVCPSGMSVAVSPTGRSFCIETARRSSSGNIDDDFEVCALAGRSVCSISQLTGACASQPSLFASTPEKSADWYVGTNIAGAVITKSGSSCAVSTTGDALYRPLPFRCCLE